MKKVLIGVLVIVVLAGGYFGVTRLGPGRAAAATSTPVPTQGPVKAGNRVVAEAKVVPMQHADLSFKTAGVVAEVLVHEGDHVEAGQTLIRLHGEQQAAAVAQAEAEVQRTQAQLNEQKAGSREQEIKAAQAAVDAAKAQLTKLTEGARPEDIAVAQAAVTAAQAELARVKEGADQQQLISAAAEVANAQAALQQAQSQYDKVKGNPDAGARPEAIALQQATNSYLAAKARYDDLAKGATSAELAKAQAGVQQAQAELNKAKVPARQSEIAAAEAEVRRAQAQLDLLQAGTRPETLQASEAAVTVAQAALKRAQADLADTELVAPFAGVVVSLDPVAGEQVAAATPVAQLGDLATWQVQTTDLTEINVVRVREGNVANITFDAVPDLDLHGKVTRIKGLGENKQGDIVYTVYVTPDSPSEWDKGLADGRLRWNMTASVSIQPQ